MKKEECCCDNSGVVSTIFGILSIVLAFSVIAGFGAGLILGIIGLIFGIISYRKTKSKWALWGIILSILGIISSILSAVWFVNALVNLAEQLQNANPVPA